MSVLFWLRGRVVSELGLESPQSLLYPASNPFYHSTGDVNLIAYACSFHVKSFPTCYQTGHWLAQLLLSRDSPRALGPPFFSASLPPDTRESAVGLQPAAALLGWLHLLQLSSQSSSRCSQWLSSVNVQAWTQYQA